MGTSWPASARKLAKPMPKTPRLSQAGQFVFFSPITFGIVRQAYPLVLTPTNKRAQNRQTVSPHCVGIKTWVADVTGVRGQTDGLHLPEAPTR